MTASSSQLHERRHSRNSRNRTYLHPQAGPLEQGAHDEAIPYLHLRASVSTANVGERERFLFLQCVAASKYKTAGRRARERVVESERETQTVPTRPIWESEIQHDSRK